MISTETLIPILVYFTFVAVFSLSSQMLLQGVVGGNRIDHSQKNQNHLRRRSRRMERPRVPETVDELGREKIGGLVDWNLDRISDQTATTTDPSSPSADANNDDAILSSFLQNSGTINELEVVEMPNIGTEEDLREEEDSTFTSTAIIAENNKTPTTTTSKKNTIFKYAASAVVAAVVLVSVSAWGLFVGLRYRNRKDRIDAKKMKQKPLAGPDTSDHKYKYKENGSVYENDTTSFDDTENTTTDTDTGTVRNHRGIVSRLVCSSAHSCTRKQQQYVAKNNNTDHNNDETNDEERKQNNNNQLPAAYQETVVL